MIGERTRLEALEAVVKADPRNAPVRLELARLLLAADRAQESLAHVRFVIGLDPTDTEALQLAGKAAELAGDREAATGYCALRATLTAAHADAEPREALPQPPADPPEDEFDENGEELTDEDAEDPDAGDVLRFRVVDGGATDDDGVVETEIPQVRLADVAGLAQVKKRLELAFLAPLRNPEIGRMYGKSLRGGLLLYGPPGCGKTFLARATAGELGARFLTIGISDVLDMWIGSSERNLHELFQLARRQAPCVLFVDEIDALGRKRSLMRQNSNMTTVVNQFLAELDGVGSSNEGVFVLAATNHPWDVDPALRRPGRLDRTLLVLPPDRPARDAILTANLSDRPTEGLNTDRIAAKSEGYSGADLAHLCEAAAEMAMEDSLKTGTPRPIRQADLKRALKDVRPSVQPWLEVARNYAMFNNEGGMYDDLVAYLTERKLC